jgi:hypothetical protein
MVGSRIRREELNRFLIAMRQGRIRIADPCDEETCIYSLAKHFVRSIEGEG